MQSVSFYQSYLDGVSRSFGFCIVELPSPQNEWVSLAYLLCRVVDTIEDSNWPSQDTQFHAFQQIKDFLNTIPSTEQFQSWFQCFPDTISAAERKLLEILPILLSDKQELPPIIHRALDKTLNRMIDGMVHFLTNHRKNNQLLLDSLELTNQYCFFAAGIVGELLSRIFTYSIPKFELSDNLLSLSFHCGLFLQKINILKDKENDQLKGRCFISSRSQLRESLVLNACYALDYLKSIPIYTGRPYRLACAWCLFLGLASLKWIDKSERTTIYYKISQRETYYIINQIRDLIDNNYALEALFRRYLPETNGGVDVITQDTNKKLPDWLTQIYQAELNLLNPNTLGILC